MNARKRYRPLDSTEERSIHVGQKLFAILLEDEKSYCMSWPESSLTSLLLKQPLKSKDTEAGKSLSSAYILIPRVFKRSEVDDFSDSFSSSFAIPWRKKRKTESKPFIEMKGCTPKGMHPRAPPRPKSSSEDSILSLTHTQVGDLKRSGALSLIKKCYQAKVSLETEEAVALAENEVISLEWRAFEESTRTAAALQRLLTLEAAIPFLPSEDEQENAWRSLVRRLWLSWRLATKLNYPLSSDLSGVTLRSEQDLHPWGPTLLCGALLSAVQQEYFLPQLVVASSAATGASHGYMDGWEPPLPRRRGAYNFLQWRVERYTNHFPGSSERRGDSDRGEGGLVGSGQLLNSQEVDDLLESEIYPRGLLNLEMDEDRSTSEKLLGFAEWSDLRQDLQRWKRWLSAVEDHNL